MLAQANGHPRDAFISFREHDHTYHLRYTDSDKVHRFGISVTGLVHHFFPAFDADKACDALLGGRSFPISPKHDVYKKLSIWMRASPHRPQVGEWVEGATIANMPRAKRFVLEEWERNRNEAAALGTAMHRACELFLNQVQQLNPNTPEFSYFQQYVVDCCAKKWSPWRTEQVLYDEALDLAGSCDMQWLVAPAGAWSATKRRQIVVADWKRSKEIKLTNDWQKGLGAMAAWPDCNHAHYCLQLNLYKYLLELHYDVDVVSMHFIVFHPNNSAYVLYDVPDMPDEIKGVCAARMQQVCDAAMPEPK